MVKIFIKCVFVILLIYGFKNVLHESGFLTSLFGSDNELEIPQLKSIDRFESDIFSFLILQSKDGILSDNEYKLGDSLITLREYLSSRKEITKVDYYYDNRNSKLFVTIYTTLKPPGNRDQSKKWVYEKKYLFNVLTKSKESSLKTRLNGIEQYGCFLSAEITHNYNVTIVVEVVSASGIAQSKQCVQIKEESHWVLYENSSKKQYRRYVRAKRKNKPIILTNKPIIKPVIKPSSTNNISIVSFDSVRRVQVKPKPSIQKLKSNMKRKIIQKIKENYKNGIEEDVDDIIKHTFNETMKENDSGHMSITIKNNSPAKIIYSNSR